MSEGETPMASQRDSIPAAMADLASCTSRTSFWVRKTPSGSSVKRKAVIPSFFDGVGMGLGFSLALTMIGGIRELLGAGKLFGFGVMPASYVPFNIFIMAPGAFFVLACLTALQNKVKINGEKKGRDMSKIQSGCSSDCMNCSDSGCSRRFYGESREEVK